MLRSQPRQSRLAAYSGFIPSFLVMFALGACDPPSTKTDDTGTTSATGGETETDDDSQTPSDASETDDSGDPGTKNSESAATHGQSQSTRGDEAGEDEGTDVETTGGVETDSGSEEATATTGDSNTDEGTADTTDTGPLNASCGAGGDPTPQDLSLTKVNKGEAYYLLGVPQNIGEEPLPVVVLFHGDEGTPDNVAGWWQKVFAQHQDFILVAPKMPGSFTWSHGGPDGSRPQADWVIDVIADVAANYDVDVTRIYAVGYSGGSIFLGYQGFYFQDVFAAIQWTCGGINEDIYEPPNNEACKVHGRLVISRKDKDYLWTAAKNVERILMENDHHVEFVETQCNGHCCKTEDYDFGAWMWLKTQQKCNADLGQGCFDIDATTP